VTGSTNTAVTWSISPLTGSISNSGLYTAPASIASTQTITVSAKSAADPTKTATATLTLGSSPTTISVSVTPSSASLTAGQQAQFAATVTGSSNTAVAWSLNPAIGALSATGLYTAPASITTNQSVTITATSGANTSRTASAAVMLVPTVTPPPPPGGFSVSFTSLGNGQLRVNWTSPGGSAPGGNISLSSPGAPDWWYLSEQEVSGTTGSYTIAAPAGPGAFEFRFNPGGTNTVAARSAVLAENIAGFSLSPSAATIQPGSKMSLAFTAPAGRPGGWDGDWIVLYPASGGPDNPTWQGYPLGKASGTLSLTAPVTPGTYFFEYLVAGTGYIGTVRSTIVVN
jgi:hypothetical protein